MARFLNKIPLFIKFRRPVFPIVLLLSLLIIAGAVYLQYCQGYVWAAATGFEGKTLWDWLQLLVIPAVLGFGALWFNQAARSSEQKIAYDRQHSETLQNYLDKMAELLLKEKLLEKKDIPDDPVVDVAQVRTVTTLRILDRDRRSFLFQFLRDANLADFILVEASLGNADLSYARMHKINLSKADLFSANLRSARLLESNLSGAWLVRVNLSRADLRGADLSNAELREAILSGARMDEANLSGADLSKTNLTGAKVTEEQLNQAKSLSGATMPDGTIYKP